MHHAKRLWGVGGDLAFSGGAQGARDLRRGARFAAQRGTLVTARERLGTAQVAERAVAWRA